MTTDEIRALLALAEATRTARGDRYFEALVDEFGQAATPSVVAALCRRVLALEESMRRLGYDGI